MEKKTEAQQIRELGDRLMKIHEGPFDDDNFGLGDHGRELDQDDTGDGKGYDKEPMFDQLGKIIDYSVPEFKSYKSFQNKIDEFPIARKYSKQIINFPIN